MKKMRLLCLLALLFAVGSAFKTKKTGVTIFPVSTGIGLNDYNWQPNVEPDGDCEVPKNTPCFIQLKENIDLPANGTLPPSGDIEDASKQLGAYP